MKTLQRRLGLTGVLAISVSAMLGSGLFVLPGLASAMTGPSVWLAYIVAGLSIVPAALSKAELATAMPASGGDYLYLDRSFGPLVGTIAGLGLWLSLLLKSAFALVGFGAYLSVLTRVPLKATALVLLVGVILINCFGVNIVSRLGKAVVLVAVLFSALLVGLSLGHYQPAQLEPAFPQGMDGLLSATAFVYVSFAGVTKIAAIAEEVKNPNRNLPMGMFLALFGVMAIYGGVVHMMVAVLPAEAFRTDLHPVYSLAEAVGGRGLGIAAAILGVITMTTMAVAGVLASSRFPFAMARDRLLPSLLARVNPKTVTPINAIVATGLAMALTIIFLDVGVIAKLASGFMIILFCAVNAAVIVLRESNQSWYKPGYRAPFYPGVQIVGILLGLILLYVLGLTSILAIGAIAIAGTATYLLYGRSRADRRGVLSKLGPRHDLIAARPQEELTSSLPEQASVLVPLFGGERSPEALVEAAVALADGRVVEVIQFTEIPEQIGLADMLEENPLTTSLRRRIEAMAQATGAPIEFDTTVSRDVVRTVNDVAARVHCDWVVMEWRERRQGHIGNHNPIGWLQDHLPCNLAVLKDAGVRYIRQIMVYAEPGPHDALVVRTGTRLAEAYGGTLSFIGFSPEKTTPAEQQVLADYVFQLHELADGQGQARVLSGKRRVQTLAAESAAHDLLVMGGPPTRSRLRMLVGTVHDRLTREAACSVLWLRNRQQLTAERWESGQEDTTFDLRHVIRRDCIGLNLEVKTKGQLFNRVGLDFAALEAGCSPDSVVTALREREEVMNTAVGRGLAMPHAIHGKARRTHLGIYTARTPIPYDAPDGRPVDVFFVTIGPHSARKEHLLLLAAVSKMVLETPLLERLRSAKTSGEVISIIDALRPPE